MLRCHAARPSATAPVIRHPPGWRQRRARANARRHIQVEPTAGDHREARCAAAPDADVRVVPKVAFAERRLAATGPYPHKPG
jgi:hypothetical protein